MTASANAATFLRRSATPGPGRARGPVSSAFSASSSPHGARTERSSGTKARPARRRSATRGRHRFAVELHHVGLGRTLTGEEREKFGLAVAETRRRRKSRRQDSRSMRWRSVPNGSSALAVRPIARGADGVSRRLGRGGYRAARCRPSIRRVRRRSFPGPRRPTTCPGAGWCACRTVLISPARLI